MKEIDMATAIRATATNRVPMDATRKIALITGVLFIVTYITSIPAQLLLYHPLLTDPAKYMAGSGGDAAVSLGAFLEVILVVANVGTAVVLYPILKRQNEVLAVAYIASRVLESVAIMVGIVSVLSVLTLRQNFADAVGTATVARSLVAVHDWAYLLGPSAIGVAGTGIVLGYLMFKSGLVPRWMTLLGLVGGPLIIAATVGVVFGVFKVGDAAQSIATIPEFFWELSFGIYCTVKGFRPSPITSGFSGVEMPEAPERIPVRA
jgi:hypothetical protein